MVHLTAAAIQELQRLARCQSDPNSLKLQLGVKPGCCAEWSYVFQFDTDDGQSPEAETIQIEQDGITLMVSQADSPLLAGLTIDYSEDLLGGAFRYQNPNAAYTSDCGNSFSTTLPTQPATLPKQ